MKEVYTIIKCQVELMPRPQVFWKLSFLSGRSTKTEIFNNLIHHTVHVLYAIVFASFFTTFLWIGKKICGWISAFFDSANSNSRASSLGSFSLNFDFIVIHGMKAYIIYKLFWIYLVSINLALFLVIFIGMIITTLIIFWCPRTERMVSPSFMYVVG